MSVLLPITMQPIYWAALAIGLTLTLTLLTLVGLYRRKRRRHHHHECGAGYDKATKLQLHADSQVPDRARWSATHK